MMQFIVLILFEHSAPAILQERGFKFETKGKFGQDYVYFLIQKNIKQGFKA